MPGQNCRVRNNCSGVQSAIYCSFFSKVCLGHVSNWSRHTPAEPTWKECMNGIFGSGISSARAQQKWGQLRGPDPANLNKTNYSPIANTELNKLTKKKDNTFTVPTFKRDGTSEVRPKCEFLAVHWHSAYLWIESCGCTLEQRVPIRESYRDRHAVQHLHSFVCCQLEGLGYGSWVNSSRQKFLAGAKEAPSNHNHWCCPITGLYVLGFGQFNQLSRSMRHC